MGSVSVWTATVEEVSSLFAEAWQLGVKAIAIYRDNCKVAQPLSGKDSSAAPASPPAPLRVRKRLPDDRVEVGAARDRLGDVLGPHELARTGEAHRGRQVGVDLPAATEPPELLVGALDRGLLGGVPADRDLAHGPCA